MTRSVGLWTILAAAAVVSSCGGEPPPRRGAGRAEPAATAVALGPAGTATAVEPPACEGAGDPGEASNSCLGCHQGIEPIRCADSGMQQAIVATAGKSGSNNRCVVCHGGNAELRVEGQPERGSEDYEGLAQQAHTGTAAYFEDHPGPKGFYPDPGSPWINEHSCGPCHRWQVEAQYKSLMMTEAGKIQGSAWGFGGLTGYEHRWANYEVADGEDDKVMGTDAHRRYLAELARKEPQVFVSKMSQVPAAPEGGADVTEDVGKSAFTYIRGECQRCHLGVRGQQRYGDYRGMGCTACHMPYGNAGRYEGGDQAIDHDEGGHPLVHTMQSSADSPVQTQGVRYSGVPIETCTTCHNRGRRIGVSFQGLMESPYPSPWTEDGKPQQKLHGKHYMELKGDLHAAKGLLCQDCHTSLDVHSPNRLIGAISGAVEIECFDCHGTTDRFPWELPLGYGDEYAEEPKQGAPRGTASELPAYVKEGATVPAEDGYLLSARGNPLGNVVRRGQEVQVHLASGEVKSLRPLKQHVAAGSLSLEGDVAMAQISRHTERLECYGCHATWAPQCYGCHVKIDYQKRAAHYDWIQIGMSHRDDGMTVEHTPAADAHRIPGEIIESRSFLRWEDPALAQNGEGRVAPVVPGCQTSVTVINRDGETVAANQIFRIPNAEGAGEEGQLGTDMSPLHPHTVQKRARRCESCHNDPKALGYGIGGGELQADPSEPRVVDLATAQGEPIPKDQSVQRHAIKNLTHDWSRFVSEDGEQLQTVGHHFKLSRPLNDEERAHMEREGTCLACHQTVPEQSLATSALHHIAKATGVLPKSNADHSELLHRSLLLAAWIEVGLPVLGLLGTGAVGGWWWRRRRRRGAATGKEQARSAKQADEAAADEPSDAGDWPDTDDEPESDDRG